jgi:hypothetical protein
MEYINSIINPIIDKIETLGKTSVEIYKYKIMLKASTLLTCLVYVFILSFFTLLMAININVAVAHWMGGLLGNIVFGYLVVSIFYILIIFLIYIYRSPILTRIQNYILTRFQS